jgi:hypothetical protein
MTRDDLETIVEDCLFLPMSGKDQAARIHERAMRADTIMRAADAYASDTAGDARREVLRRERADIGGRQGAASCTP